MEKLVKIGEVNAENSEERELFRETLENAGFVVIPCESYEENIIVVKRVEK